MRTYWRQKATISKFTRWTFLDYKTEHHCTEVNIRLFHAWHTILVFVTGFESGSFLIHTHVTLNLRILLSLHYRVLYLVFDWNGSFSLTYGTDSITVVKMADATSDSLFELCLQMKSLVAKQLPSILHVSHFLFSKFNEQTWFYNLLVFTLSQQKNQ